MTDEVTIEAGDVQGASEVLSPAPSPEDEKKQQFDMQIADLESQMQAIYAEENDSHALFKNRKREIADQIERLRAEARVADLAGSMSEAEKEALRQFLASNGQEG